MISRSCCISPPSHWTQNSKQPVNSKLGMKQKRDYKVRFTKPKPKGRGNYWWCKCIVGVGICVCYPGSRTFSKYWLDSKVRWLLWQYMSVWLQGTLWLIVSFLLGATMLLLEFLIGMFDACHSYLCSTDVKSALLILKVLYKRRGVAAEKGLLSHPCIEYYYIHFAI